MSELIHTLGAMQPTHPHPFFFLPAVESTFQRIVLRQSLDFMFPSHLTEKLFDTKYTRNTEKESCLFFGYFKDCLERIPWQHGLKCYSLRKQEINKHHQTYRTVGSCLRNQNVRGFTGSLSVSEPHRLGSVKAESNLSHRKRPAHPKWLPAFTELEQVLFWQIMLFPADPD